MDLVRQTLTSRGLEVTAVHPATRRVKVAGSLADLASAFGTTLRQAVSPAPGGRGQVTHRYREGPLSVPAELDGVVIAVLGLDTRPQARPHFRARAAAAAGHFVHPRPGGGRLPVPGRDHRRRPGSRDHRARRRFPGQRPDTYFGSLDITVPSVTAVGVDGAANAPGSDPGGADVEVALDIEVTGAAAPGAAQLVYFAPNTDQGFVDAISDAASASPAPAAISVSWGESEDSWTAQGLSAMNAAMADATALGITVCAASGDNGSSDGVSGSQPHCDFPASSPYALGCGGTRLTVTAAGAISSEVAWNETASGEGATGGGVSDKFPLPSWQARRPASRTGRAPEPPGAACRTWQAMPTR